MYRQLLKSKLQEVVVTQANIDYQGSITIDEDLMDAAGLIEYERVEVNGKTNPSRIVTYVIKGERGTGIIALNGGAALHFSIGDKVHILSFCFICANLSPISPVVVYTNEINRIL
jgi:aspartate 1-decarboxylase